MTISPMERVQKQIKEHPLILERMPGILHTIHYPGIIIVEDLDKIGLSWLLMYTAIKNNNMILFIIEDRLVELGEKFLKKELKKPGSYSKLIKGWEGYDVEYKRICKKIDSLDLKELSLAELKKLYFEFSKWYRKVWTIPITSNYISYYGDNIGVPKIIEKYGGKGIKDFLALCTPVKLSFIKQEEKELLKIAIRVYDNKKLRKKVLEGKFTQKDSPLLYDKLKEHANSYHWLKNNYRDGIRLDVNYFLDKLKDDLSKNPKIKLKLLEKEKKVLEKKHKTLPKKFTREEKVLAHLIDKATTLQDLRKKSNLIGDYYIFKFLKVISKKTKYSFKELCFTNLDEIEKILSGKKVSGLKSRIKCCVELLEVGYDKIFGGKEALELYDIIDNADSIKSEVSEIRGVAASLGKVRGVVRVVLDVSRAKEFNKGDILVASMTRPDYTTLMKKASAIITDEGGVTCHAAIVSRELGIPCIINTKIATRALKNGDLVEVDAYKGIVKKIK